MEQKGDILIISNYFPPETGAASNRIFSLAKMLKDNGYIPTVVSPLPNYPKGKVFKGYKNKLFKTDNYSSILTKRLFIFPSNSTNKFIRLFSMLSFCFSLIIYVLIAKTPSKFIIQCSPLFVGYFAVIAGKLKGKEIILNVSDLWPKAGLEMGILKEGKYYNILLYMESFIYKHSHKIIGQSNEILNHIRSILGDNTKPLFLYRNFPFFSKPEIIENDNNDVFRIVYAGLIGVAQGIESIVKEVKFPENFEFHIYGDGPLSKRVANECKKNNRLYYHGSLKREDLHKTIACFDATLIPLKNRIYGSVPSKIFEYAKLGLPIIYFSDGEGAEIIESLKIGITQREIDYRSLEQKLMKLSKGEFRLPEKTFVQETAFQEFNVKRQFRSFQKDILDQ